MAENLFLGVCFRTAIALVLWPMMAAAQNSQIEQKVDPGALAALDRMGNTLRSLQHFSIRSDTSSETVMDTGEKVQFNGVVNYLVQTPDKLFVDVRTDRRHRQFYFDQGVLTVYAPNLKYYASTDRFGRTLADALVGAADNYGLDFPLEDLFFWGTPYVSADALTSAEYIGEGRLDGELVRHYSFRQPGIDWQLWLSSTTSLPKRLVITSLSDPALPQYSATLHWDTDKISEQGRFEFSPPKDAVRIQLAQVSGADPQRGAGR
ncbi:DUF2092 domain-containing protein [Stenotrophomonas indicatrix]|uniref:DUF2092 domain-containing protein n=1 Tax=Stenotrophomonas indicatrix TaxID=2045451 RepID=UPI0013FE39A7|nr:DUF2092 domain-containing protein [Stenotrophomonas indicatrix]